MSEEAAGDGDPTSAESDASASRDAETGAAVSTDDGRNQSGTGGPSWLYLLGLLGFLVTGLAFLVDLWTGHGVLRSVVLNALAAVVLVTWAGLDSYRDAASGVETLAGAIGTGMILVGVYLLAAGAVVAVTSVVHGRLVIGLGMVAGGVPLVLGGFLVFPVDAVLGGDDDLEADRTEGPGGDEPES